MLCQGTSKFGISARLRELMCLLGQSNVYSEASELFDQLMGLEISPAQIQRVSTYYGSVMDPLIESNCESILPKLKRDEPEDTTYVMIDGSMVFTREDKWREIKLGRVFKGSQVAEVQEDRKEIINSLYVSHLGSVDKFFPKFERIIQPYKNKVIIGDGAKWIWNWVEDNYPGATQILDFFHAKEKLTLLAKHQFKDEKIRLQWIHDQTEKLLENKVEEVIEILKRLRSRNEESKKAKQKAIDYYLEHDDRMQYKTYCERGLMIGSGPIEAAHRSVIQQRLKLSGQKWSIEGANAIANLRCYRQSGAWTIIRQVIAAAA